MFCDQRSVNREHGLFRPGYYKNGSKRISVARVDFHKKYSGSHTNALISRLLTNLLRLRLKKHIALIVIWSAEENQFSTQLRSIYLGIRQPTGIRPVELKLVCASF